MKHRSPLLQTAIETGNIGLVEAYLKAGSDVNAVDVRGRDLLSILENSFGSKPNSYLYAVMHLLEKHGFTPNKIPDYSDFLFTTAITLFTRLDPNVANTNGLTPLMQSAKQGYINAISILIAKGANVEARDTYGRTPLLLATVYGNISAVWILLKEGAKTAVVDNDGFTPAMHLLFGLSQKTICVYGETRLDWFALHKESIRQSNTTLAMMTSLNAYSPG